jgi:hypothetical protein
METLGDNLVANSGNKFDSKYFCEKCDYICSKKYNWIKHLSTTKHERVTKGDNLVAKSGKKVANIIYCCEKCNKGYTSRNGLWKHNKNCNIEKNNITILETNQYKTTQEVQELKEFIKYLMKENSDFKNIIMDTQNQMLKVIENGTNNTNTNCNNNINSHNKSFNLNFFLNETCKNAMNITDFVNSLQLQLSDLEKVGELGYIEGISNIIIKNLNALDVTERPIHCTDKKRETMYVKDENKWEKEDDNNTKLHKMVRKVSNKNIDLISNFKELYPDWKKSTSKISDQFNKIIIESMGGAGDNDYEKEGKIIKNVAKAVLVDKTL